MNRLSALLTLALFSARASATTWIVDDGGGAGVDFTSIQAAIDASAPGDVLLVQPGNYTTFTVSIPLSILGQGSPTITGPSSITVSNLAAGGRVVLVGLTAPVAMAVHVHDCAGTVIGDDLQCGNGLIDVTNSADVRLRRTLAQRMTSVNSRTEIVDSPNFHGFNGSGCFCCPTFAMDGHDGVTVSGGELHFARSSSVGGDGGDESCIDPGVCQGAGYGGHGIRLSSSAGALVSGGIADLLAGGSGGDSSGGCSQAQDGQPGVGVSIGAGCQARISGVGGVAANVAPADPTMRLLETPIAGTNLTFRVNAPPGSNVDIVLGRQPILVDVPGLEEDVLTTTNRTFHLGTVPASGVASLNFPTSASWPKGFLLVFQAVATLPDSTVRRTHSIPVVFR